MVCGASTSARLTAIIDAQDSLAGALDGTLLDGEAARLFRVMVPAGNLDAYPDDCVVGQVGRHFYSTVRHKHTVRTRCPSRPIDIGHRTFGAQRRGAAHHLYPSTTKAIDYEKRYVIN
jgi:hypothetical protein